MNRKKSVRNKNKQFIILRLFLLLILLLLSRNIYLKFVKDKTLLITETKKYEKIVNANVVIIREEYIYSFGENVNLDSVTDNRIGANNNLGSIVDYSNRYGLGTNQNSRNLLIDKSSDNQSPDYESVNTIETIENIRNRNYKDIGNIDIVSVNESHQNYQIQQNKILDYVMESNGKKLKALNSGVISTKVDGYEDIYNIFQMDLDLINLNLDMLNNFDFVKKNGFKIINNNYYGMVISIKKNDLLINYGVGDYFTVKSNKKELIGVVNDIKIKEDDIIVVVTFDTGFELFQDKRFFNIDIVNYSTNAIEIPERSLVEKNSQVGAFIKNTKGLIEFKPVEVINIVDKNAIINYGDNGTINLNNKKTETIQIFDEIIINPTKVKVGEILG